MFERFTPDSRRAVVIAQEVARAAGASAVAVENLVFGALTDPYAIELLRLAGVEASAIQESLTPADGQTQVPGHLPFTDWTKKALEQALHETIALGHNGITGAHLLLGALVASPQGPFATALLANGSDLASLRELAGRLPVVDGGEGYVEVIEKLANSPSIAPPQKRDLELDLVPRLIGDTRLGEARELAERLLAEADETALHRSLTAIGELTGDVNLVLRHGPVVVKREDAPDISGTLGVALAHAGRTDAWDHIERGLEATGVTGPAAHLEGAEVALLLGDVPTAERLVASVSPENHGEHRWLVTWIAIVQADIAHLRGSGHPTRGQLENATTPEAETALPRLLNSRVAASIAREELRAGSARKAAKMADAAVSQSEGAGFNGAKVEAMEVRAAVLKSRGHRSWKAAAVSAADLAEHLGRHIQAERIRLLLDDE